MEQNKTLALQLDKKTYNDPKTGVTRNYNVFYVELNGIKLYLKAGDNTAKTMLENYFGA